MTALLVLSAGLALAGALILWATITDRRRRKVRYRLASIAVRGPGQAMQPAVPFMAPRLHLAALDRHLEILGWRPARALSSAGGGLLLLFGLIALLQGPLSASLATVLAVAAMVKGLHILAGWARTRFAEDLPLMVDRLRQLIVAGNGITLAFNKALRSCPPHAARLLAPVSLAVDHGMSLSDALHQRAVRLVSPDLFLLAAIVKTSTQFGGDFSSALKHFEAILSNRIRCHREIRALTSELRMTTLILLSLPVVTALGIFFANRDYIRFFVEAPQGPPALIYVGGSIALGVFLVTRLSSVEY